MATPIFISPVVCPAHRRDRHRERGIVDKVPHRRVSNILVAFDPGPRGVSHPGSDGHNQGIDTRVGPLL